MMEVAAALQRGMTSDAVAMSSPAYASQSFTTWP